MKSEYVQINKHIDSLPFFGNWELDIIIVFVIVVTLCVGISTSFMFQILGGVGGLVVAKAYSMFKESAVKGFARHLCYRIGLLKPKRLLPSYMRYFVGA